MISLFLLESSRGSRAEHMSHLIFWTAYSSLNTDKAGPPKRGAGGAIPLPLLSQAEVRKARHIGPLNIDNLKCDIIGSPQSILPSGGTAKGLMVTNE